MISIPEPLTQLGVSQELRAAMRRYPAGAARLVGAALGNAAAGERLARSLEEAIEVANGVEYGLSSAIFTQDVNKAFVAMRDLEAGIFYVNLPTIGAETHLPFGGTKKTGNGHREAGLAALDVFSEWKSIYVDYSGKIQKAQIDVPDQPVVKRAKR